MICCPRKSGTNRIFLWFCADIFAYFQNLAIANRLIMTVKAIDKDENENGRVTYHFKVDGENVNETTEFSIDENTGELRTKLHLDREIRAVYQVSSVKSFFSAYIVTNCFTVGACR